MDASNEFRFISSPGTSAAKKKLKSTKSHGQSQDPSATSDNLRSVPICATNSNRNVKLRFVWDKAFKLFQSHRTVYRAMSGINYQDYGESNTNTAPHGSSRPSSDPAAIGQSPVGRSQSHSELNLCPGGSDSQESGRKTRENNTAAESRHQRPVSISGGEKPEGDEAEKPSEEDGYRRLPNASTSLAMKKKKSNGSSIPAPVNRKTLHHNNHVSSHHQPVEVRRSQSAKSRRNPFQHRAISDDEDLERSGQGNYPGSSQEPLALVAPKRHSYSPDSYAQDSGLDTWKKTANAGSSASTGSSIVCTISQRIPDNGRAPALERVQMQAPETSSSGTHNKTVVLLNESAGEELNPFSDDYDVECMSEIDLNSEPGSGDSGAGVNEEEEFGSVSELKMKFLMNHGQFPATRSFLYPDSNELDSLDLTLFESREQDRSFLRGLRAMQDLEEVSSSLSSSSIQRMMRMEEGGCDCGSETHFYDMVSGNGSEAPSGIYAGEETGLYWNWTDAGSEFEFMAPAAAPARNREIPLGHSPKGQAPQVEWEPYFCVLNQLDQTFTSYRSEEMSFGGDGVSPTEIVRVRLDGGPNSVKCLINNSKWGMNPVLEEEEGESSTVMLGGIEKEAPKSGLSAAGAGDYSSGGSGSNHRNSSPASIHHDTSYDKACGSEQQQRRSSAPLTPLLGRDTPSRFANFFSKRSFKSNPLKRTKSVTKLERKKVPGMESEQSAVYPTRLRTSRSHESLLAWSTHSMNNFVNNGMMSTLDLTAGDVTIRPLHPSILGQEYGFQIITQSTGSGSKYYSCSSLPERDAWVNALQQAIRPHADEVRRLENSLKIWILEGKGLLGGSGSKQATKRYFCELYLDETLYARTSAKPRGEMLFWGEHFEFTQLPNCVQLITVVFFREGDKKRKKERNTCIGKVKIPVNTVNSRYLIEKWYPVLPDTPSQKEKENGSKDTKEGPSLRIKCKFQSVDILPLRCYKPFLQYVKDEYGPVSECLEGVLSVKAKEDLANAMVHVLHHEGLAKEFIAELALQEILRSGDEKLTFRGNSIATKAMEAFLKLTGSEYLHATLGSFIETFQGSEDLYDCEIDSMKLSQGSSLAKNQENLRRAVDAVWKQIVQSHAIFPIELRDCFAHCREALKSAGRDELSDHLISASIFLRFLCPAILSPSLFNITNEYPTEKSARNLTLVAKVLQTLANFTRFQGKENYMEFINDFVEREAPNMKIFLARISSPLEGESGKKAGLTRVDSEEDKVPQPLPGGFIDLGKYSSILSTLLSESVAKIAPKNERFKKLQDILETIHSWLKQPLNATNVTNFPFPHLASPPPNGPPPPAPMLGLPPPPLNMNHRAPTPILSPASSQHQYQIPINSTTPIYAVTNVIHNTANPNVKNISHVQLLNHNSGYQNGPVPLHLQIPHVNSGHIILSHNNSQRSGSQASSGYQSQSPVLEGEAKSKNNSPQMSSTEQPGIHVNGHNVVSGGQGRIPTPLSFSNPGFTNRKSGSQSVDDLSSIGVDGGPAGYKKRLTRSSSSSDCEYASSTMASTKAKVRATKPASKPHGKNTKVSSSAHNRLSRRSSAELLRKHPYSSSTDEDSDSGHVNDKDMEPAPQLPPRRSHGSKIRYSVGPRPNPDGSHHGGEKSLEEYELEMMELRRAMESLQVKLNRAEERLFGHDSPSHGNGNSRRESDISLHSQHSPALSVHNSESSRNSRAVEENSKEMEQLLQRFLSAEEEMKREQELLTALDRKQKLIEAQEQKISRLDAVNNQLLSALSQIRDSLQQQHVQQQQIKIQQQLQKQQQHLESLSHGLVIPTDCSGASGQNRNSSHLRATTNYLNNNFSCGPNNVNQVSVGLPDRPPHRLQPSPRYSLMNATNNNNQNNTTKVLITSDHSGSSGNVSPDSLDNGHHEAHDYCSSGSNRDSSTILGEQALKMLADLKSSSC